GRRKSPRKQRGVRSSFELTSSVACDKRDLQNLAQYSMQPGSLALRPYPRPQCLQRSSAPSFRRREGWETAPRSRPGTASGQNPLDYIAANVRQAETATAVAKRQTGVIQAQQMQDRRVEIMNVALVLDHPHAVIVSLAVDHAGFDAAAGQPRRVGMGEMAAPVIALRRWRAA